MNESHLLKLALISSLIGLFVLYIVSNNMDIKEISLDELNNEEIGNKVKVLGKVSRITELDKVTFLDVSQPVTTKIVIFREKEKDEALDLEQDDYIEIIGKVEDYEGEMEIIADRIRIVE
tara:strand:+ start:6774 stop:7133 length:360 start_codon:yes stop_codon:yes gene_type:complete